METTIVSSDGSTEVMGKPPIVEEKPKVQAEVKPETVVEDDDDDAADGELSERAKRIIAKKEASIGKKHRAMKEAEELARDQFNERKTAEKRAEDLAAELAALKSQAAKAPEKTRADFTSDEEWIDYRAELRIQAKEKQRLEDALKLEKEELENAHRARIEAYAATVPDWSETLESLGDSSLAISPAFEQFMYESEDSPKLLYHYAKHPGELKELLKLKPTRQIKALGDLENKLTDSKTEAKAEKPDPAKTLSRAPAPITPINESSSPNTKDPMRLAEEGRTDEFLALMRERRKKAMRH
jgi:hypothetical protein